MKKTWTKLWVEAGRTQIEVYSATVDGVYLV